MPVPRQQVQEPKMISDQIILKDSLLVNKNGADSDVSQDDAGFEIVFEGDWLDDLDGEGSSSEDSGVEPDESEESEYDYESEIDVDDYYEESDNEENQPEHFTSSPPFWYSHEDTAQISAIIDSYSATLKLDQERESCIRAPMPFIGRVKRVQVDNDLFTTLDQISIYQRDFRPLGVSLPFNRDVWLLTSWDVEDGTPLRSFEIPTDALLGFWQARSHGEFSYMFCCPMYHTKSDWKFEVLKDDYPVLWASPLYSATKSFNLYLPKSLKSIPSAKQEEEDLFV